MFDHAGDGGKQIVRLNRKLEWYDGTPVLSSWVVYI